MAKKLTGKYVEGQEPWVLAGIKRPSFYDRLRREAASGEADGPMHQAQRQALEIAASDGPAASVEAPAAPAAPEAVREPVQAKAERTTPSEPMPPPPAPTSVRADPVTPSETMPRQGGATVNVTLRSAPAQHERLRRMSFDTRRPIQDLVSTAVDEYLSRSDY